MINKNSYALIQVDCDREWNDINISVDILKLMIKIFKSYHLNATFFVVGNDLKYKPYRELIKLLILSGFEIGNHTFLHTKNFQLLDNRSKWNEIYHCDRMIKELGYVPQGFRTPYFGLDAETVGILDKLGYQYDSSILPSIAYQYISRFKSYLNKENTSFVLNGIRERHNLIKDSRIFEIPVSVMPIINFPFHASYAMVLPKRLSHLGTKILLDGYKSEEKILTYVFHLNDLCPNKYLKSKEFKLFNRWEVRVEFFEWVCKKIADSFTTINAVDYVQLEKTNKQNDINIGQ